MNIPDIMTANCYFWKPSGSASGRRANEKRHCADVQKFIDEYKDVLDAAGIEIEFSYSESAKKVYKRCTITKHGRRSNITVVKRAIDPPPAKIRPPKVPDVYDVCVATLKERRKRSVK